MIIGKPFDFSDKYDAKLSSADFEVMDKIVREKMLEAQKELSDLLAKKKVKVKK